MAGEEAHEETREGEAVDDASAAEPAETLGERRDREAYEDCRLESAALPNAADFQALVTKWGQRIGYRCPGQWVAGRAPKAAKPSQDGGAPALPGQSGARHPN